MTHTSTEQPEALMRLADNYAEACFDQGLNQRTTDDKPETEREKLEKAIRRQHARIAELEAQLSAIGAGGVEPLRKAASAPAPNERAAFEAWLRVKPCGAAHDFAWEAWKARAALSATQPSETAPLELPEPFTTLVRKKSWSTNCYEASPRCNHRDYGRSWADERVQVYTEQQVRALLSLAAQAKQGGV